MKYAIFYLSITFCLLSCIGGSDTPNNSNFTEADRKKEIPFNKLIGTYQLDEDSKMRYNISDSINLELKIIDSNKIRANNFINMDNRKVEKRITTEKLSYTNDYKEKNPSLYLRVVSKDLYPTSTIDIYFRKKDSAVALLVYTPPVGITKENDKYIEGDYLRYIKVN